MAEMSYKEEFIKIYKDNIKRQGADSVLAWLEDSDFFTAPASTRFHLAEETGLLQHSINVYKQLGNEAWIYEKKTGEKYSSESIAIVALLHDICKANYYKKDYRNVKTVRAYGKKHLITLLMIPCLTDTERNQLLFSSNLDFNYPWKKSLLFVGIWAALMKL